MTSRNLLPAEHAVRLQEQDLVRRANESDRLQNELDDRYEAD
jgi:hypothetical protein